jgi:hypothetical protein
MADYDVGRVFMSFRIETDTSIDYVKSYLM